MCPAGWLKDYRTAHCADAVADGRSHVHNWPILSAHCTKKRSQYCHWFNLQVFLVN